MSVGICICIFYFLPFSILWVWDHLSLINIKYSQFVTEFVKSEHETIDTLLGLRMWAALSYPIVLMTECIGWVLVLSFLIRKTNIMDIWSGVSSRLVHCSASFNLSEQCPCGNEKQICIVCTWDHGTLSCYFHDNWSHCLVLLPLKLCVRGRRDADYVWWGKLKALGNLGMDGGY
jgi:hypothetical protein